MSNAKRLILLLILLGVTFCHSSPASAQLTPPLPTWQNDASGRPAPPCFFYDPATNKTVPCTTTNPLPTSAGGAGAGQGTTSGTSTTGFGKGWFPTNLIPAGNFVPVFNDNAATVVAFNRTVGCANCLTVSTSTDGGVTYTSFNTSFIVGNEVGVMVKVPSTVPRYLGYAANGAGSHIFSSTGLLSGWADSTYGGTQLNNSPFSFASNANGSVVLSSAGTAAAVEVCKSTNQGVTFGSCVTFGTANPGSIAFAGGTSWLSVNNGGQLFRSTNDGASFALITTFAGGGGGGASVVCSAPTYTQCVANFNGNILSSLDAGLTWTSTFATGQTPALCDYSGGIIGLFGQTPPVGFSATTQNVATTFNGGISWFPGNVFGSAWTGVGGQSVTGYTCNSSGRSAAAIHVTAGPIANFIFYNPLTQPGGTLQSSAGGYNVSALIQSGVIQNATQTSAATTAQTITLTGTSGSRVCLRRITVFSSAATQNLTLVVQDATVTTLNFGTVSTSATAGNPLDFAGQPLFCGQTGDSLQVVVGAAAAGTTTLSVIADRYPN